jgi:hypothetical protein
LPEGLERRFSTPSTVPLNLTVAGRCIHYFVS